MSSKEVLAKDPGLKQRSQKVMSEKNRGVNRKAGTEFSTKIDNRFF